MISTVHRPQVEAVLARLRKREDENDAEGVRKLISAAGPEYENRFRNTSPATFADLAKDISMAVPKETGELLYLLARLNQANGIVEFGTSFGMSTVYLAAAVRDNGGGWVVGTELSADKVADARANVDEAGLSDLVDIRAGDALETLRELPGTVDLLLLDGWPSQSLPLLRLLEPKLRTGSVVITDGLPDPEHCVVDPSTMDDLYEYLRDRANGYLSVCLPILGEEIELSIRL